ncbi:YcdB/YcdC domain-containing protein [Paenibacillus sp. UNC499MF]|uniref:YcdB/YcdC domain-containing protein n=1 Tax=Paenibacillus sp. UNC499MF TaxID=1502751 RepID=UPI00089FEBB1|nr:YcdB/YcdC domain-containing protein [Paenibacillus sp. UNC499MF]SEG03472.1 S-layer homology domain-containing protein [Paenibacillus sp. UNC499MF]
MNNKRAVRLHKAGLLTVAGSLGVGLLLPGNIYADNKLSTPAYRFQEDAKVVTGITPVPSTDVRVNAKLEKEAKITKEQAIARLKELFPDLKKAEVSSAKLDDSTDSYPPASGLFWTITWSVTTGNSTSSFHSTVDAEIGDVLSTAFPPDRLQEEESFYPPAVNQEKAVQIALDFVKKAVPSLEKETLEPYFTYGSQSALFGPVSYDLSFRRKVNGLFVDFEGINVRVNGEGRVTGLMANFHRSPFPSVTPKLTGEEAAAKYKKDFTVDLQYVKLHSSSGSEEWILGYVRNPLFYMPVDAQSGEYVSTGIYTAYGSSAYVDIPKSGSSFKAHTGGTLSAEQAVELVKATGYVPEGSKLVQKSEQEDWRVPGQLVWSLNWEEETENGNKYNAVVDARTGQILELSDNGVYPPWNRNPDVKARSITQETADARALQLIDKLIPQASENWKLVKNNLAADNAWNKKNEPFTYQFQRVYKGIPVQDQLIILHLRGDGSLYTLQLPYEQEDIEEALKAVKPAAVTKEEALKRLQGDGQVSLSYTMNGAFYNRGDEKEKKLLLVYRQVAGEETIQQVLDASSGKIRDMRPFSQPAAKPPEAKDIQGHWAQKELVELVRLQVFVPEADGNVNPDAVLTYGDWLTMFARGIRPVPFYGESYRKAETLYADVQPGSPYYGAVSLLTDLNRLKVDPEKKLGVDEPLTREKLAWAVVNELRYEKLSSLLNKPIGKIGVTDEDSIGNKADVFLVMKLGLMQDIGGEFRPHDKVTRAQAAIVLMRMAELQGRTDQPVAY